MNTIFLQFYYKMDYFDNAFSLINGFSDTWDFCKEHGEFLWIERSKDGVKDEYIIQKFPIEKGVVYVSTILISEISLVKKLAITYPNINFIIGGPSTIYLTKEDKEHGIKNLQIFYGSVEEYFNFPDFSYDWKVEFPDIKSSAVNYNYTIDMNCYWKKCTFCNICKINYRRKRPLSLIKNRFEKLSNVSRYETVRIGSLAIPPNLIEEWFPKITLEKDVNFDFYIRLDKQTVKKMRKTIPKVIQRNKETSFFAHLGIEFLSNRMLKIMKKGVTTEDIIEGVILLRSYNINMVPTIIVGWPELEKQDIVNLEKAIKVFRKNQKCYVYCLTVDNFIPLSNIYPSIKGKRLWYPIQNSSDYVKDLNLEALKILDNHFNLLGTEEVRRKIIN